MTVLTVVLEIANLPDFRSVLSTFDAQTLASDKFEVLLVGALSERDWETVQAICNYRPNVRALPKATIIDGLTAGAGEYALVLGTNERLFPRGLESAVLAIDESTSEPPAILARHVGDALTLIPRQLWRDGELHQVQPGMPDEMAATDDEQALQEYEPSVIARRWQARLTPAGRILIPSDRVTTSASYPLLHRFGPQEHSLDGLGVATLKSSEWAGTRLRITVDVSSISPSADLLLRLRHEGSHLEFIDPISRETVETAGFDLDIKTAAGGAPLPDGRWSFVIQSGDAASDGILFRIGGNLCGKALIDGRAVIQTDIDGTAGIDIGGTRETLVTRADIGFTTIDESAAGSSLSLSLPRLHLARAQTVNGRLGLGRLVLPARITMGDNGPELKTMLTGPKGIEPLSVSFGGGPLRASGVSVDVSEVGTMSLVPTPAPAPKRTAPKGVKTSQPSQPASRKTDRAKPRKGLVADLRRAAPPFLEPAIRRLRRSRTVRKVYRRLTHA